MATLTVEHDRKSRTATVRVRGDVTVPSVSPLYTQLRSLTRRRDVQTIVVDFAGAGRLDSSALAAVSLTSTHVSRLGKQLDLSNLSATHRAAIDLIPEPAQLPPAIVETPSFVERFGDRVVHTGESFRAMGALIADVARQLAAVATRRKRLPRGAFLEQCERMGVNGLGIVALLAGLLGMTLGFQGVVLLQRFGAGVFVADMIGISMVREFGPMMTAIILTGRTGAAIAAELGTMRVRAEIDALSTMGVSPTRFLVLPRLLALTLVQPALTLMAMFIGIAGGMLVAAFALHLPPDVFWARICERIAFADFVHGIGKSVIFAWIIGFTGSYLGMRASADASSVGGATTRTVVVSVFFIILVDAIAATISTIGAHT